MLHRMDAWVASEFQRMDWDGAAALGRRALVWFGLAGTVFLLCKAQLPPTMAPFGMAFLAAALAARKSGAALLVGCVLAALGGSPAEFNLRLPAGAAIVLGGGIAWDALAPALRRALGQGLWLRIRKRETDGANRMPRRQARSPNPRDGVACSALAGLGVLVPGLIGLGEVLWPRAAEAVAASVAAVAAAPFFRAALEARPGRRWLNAEERAGVFLLWGFMLVGLGRLSLPVALCVGGALAQLLTGAGALAGVCTGAALLIAGADPRMMALTAVGGATVQLCAGMSRPTRAACACGTMLAVGLWMNVPPGWLLSTGASSLLVAPMPEPWARALSHLSEKTPDPCDPKRLASRLQRGSVARLRALGAAFGELAEGYGAPASLPDERELVQRLRRQLCEGCAGYAKCWQGGGEGGARLLCDLIARAVALSGETPLFEGESPPELCRRCRRGRLIPERIGDMLEDFARARRDGLKRGAENRLISAQFRQARQLIEALARQQGGTLRLRYRQASRAAVVLERAGIGVESVMALGGKGVEIVAALKEGCWTRTLARQASQRLSEAFGRRYAPTGPLGRELRFVRRPRLRVCTGISCASREAGAPCGDSHLACMLDDERLLVLVCDGMGSGEAARRESAVAARLLGRFLRAGATCDLAIETVNALLLNRSGEDMFATVDMLIINLNTGEAELVKLAACPTLILRGEALQRVEGGRLPLGILERVQPGGLRTRLLPGDVLLMASDGVADAAGEQALERLMRREGEDMPRLARLALASAERACQGGRRDDMTAVCLRVEER